VPVDAQPPEYTGKIYLQGKANMKPIWGSTGQLPAQTSRGVGAVTFVAKTHTFQNGAVPSAALHEEYSPEKTAVKPDGFPEGAAEYAARMIKEAQADDHPAIQALLRQRNATAEGSAAKDVSAPTDVKINNSKAGQYVQDMTVAAKMNQMGLEGQIASEESRVLQRRQQGREKRDAAMTVLKNETATRAEYAAALKLMLEADELDPYGRVSIAAQELRQGLKFSVITSKEDLNSGLKSENVTERARKAHSDLTAQREAGLPVELKAMKEAEILQQVAAQANSTAETDQERAMADLLQLHANASLKFADDVSSKSAWSEYHERRIAPDGGRYTKHEFVQYFGFEAESQWDAAAPKGTARDSNC